MASGWESAETARLYQSVRPGYSDEVVNACIERAQFASGARLLELGAGPGEATVAFAGRGYQITAVEPSPAMLEAGTVGGELWRYIDNGTVTLVNDTFEHAATHADELGEGKVYDGVYAATSWDVLGPESRVLPQIHRLLRSAGRLAILHNNRTVSDGKHDELWRRMQAVWQQFGPYVPTTRQPIRTRRANELQPVQLDKQYFRPIFFTAFTRTDTYTAEQYTDFMRTLSSYLELSGRQQRKVIKDMRRLINNHFGGVIDIPKATTLQVAEKV